MALTVDLKHKYQISMLPKLTNISVMINYKHVFVKKIIKYNKKYLRFVKDKT